MMCRVGYITFIMFSTAAPGNPAWLTDPAVFSEIAHESFNFFYISVGLHAVGLPVPDLAEHPVSEALFNFVNAWGMLFLPVMAIDTRTSYNMPRWRAWWVAIMFLTNVFFIPFLALRALPLPHPSGLTAGERTQASLSASPPHVVTQRIQAHCRRDVEHQPEEGQVQGGWRLASRIIGGVALFIGGLSIAWAVHARPEFGGIADRAGYAQDRFNGERVFFAFVLDTGLYAVWQAWLLGSGKAPARFRYVPFFGLCVWLLLGQPKK
jgi:hypothetical protein